MLSDIKEWGNIVQRAQPSCTGWLRGGAKITTRANPGGWVGCTPAHPLKTELEFEVVWRISSIYCIQGAQTYT